MSPILSVISIVSIYKVITSKVIISKVSISKVIISKVIKTKVIISIVIISKVILSKVILSKVIVSKVTISKVIISDTCPPLRLSPQRHKVMSELAEFSSLSNLLELCSDHFPGQRSRPRGINVVYETEERFKSLVRNS
jgi:hypothetical protein